MSSKIKLKQAIPALLLIILWVLYFINSYSLFSQISIFVTPGSSYIIKLLEFTNYRPKELSYIFISYFVLISVCTYGYSFIYNKITNKKKILMFISIGYVILFGILFGISNIFLPVYILITLLSNIIIIASFYIANTLWSSYITFEKDDIIFKSNEYLTEKEAQEDLSKLLSDSRLYYKKEINGEIFIDKDKFYFEIYALNKIKIDRKEDLHVYEKF